MPRGNADFLDHVRNRAIQPPPILYKYRTVETAHKVLSTGKLRHSSPILFNDPFDTQWDPMWSLQTPEAHELAKAMAREVICDPNKCPPETDPAFRRAIELEHKKIAGLSAGERDKALEKLLNMTASERKPARNPLAALVTRLRVLSLCANQDSHLMWSHYAEQHHGIVLGFDVHTLENGWQRPIERVEYTIEIPKLLSEDEWLRAFTHGLPDPETPPDVTKKWTLTKSKHWEYEQEWRFVWVADKGTLGNHYDQEFAREALVQLVTGCRTSPAVSQELQGLARLINPKVQVFRMEVCPSRFELVKKPVERGG